MTENTPTLRLGIDLGGTKTEIIALEHEGGIEKLRRRVPSVRGDYDATIRGIRDLIAEAEKTLGRTGTIGIGTPGTSSPETGLIKNSNSTWLNGKPLRADLEAALGRPVRLANDADCFALSEATDGAGAGASSVFGVILGTGVGGGIVVNGRLVSGPNGICGEWGHNPLPWPQEDERNGPYCYCGRCGCIETYLSGPGLERAAGHGLKTHDIVAAADSGDDLAEGVMSRYEDRLARSLAVVINILDPEVIVLGGGLGNIARLYREVPKMWGEYVFSDRVLTKLVSPRHGDSSGVRGAAWLWDDARS